MLRDTIALDFVFLTNTASAIVSLETQDLDHSAALVAAIGRAGIFVA
jgi:hypothetical protein